ncbi:MAG: redox-regulated ATPase YchF [Candidatus Nomurabacteria bacterium]|jgi:GTP-binding protein YchF|nr:redox-regulated ATPase YchF [Candidatus Nomurabacteria bacterium]
MLKIGIVGLPNVGKSTLFNVLTNAGALAANYPFATIEPNTGIVPVPDPRLDVLAKMYHTQKIVPATVKFIDIAGLVAGASKGEGLGNKFLANIRECDAIVHVVRDFADGGVVHVADRISPRDDIDIINTELVLSDIETLEKVIPRLQKEAKAGGDAKAKLEFFQNLLANLQQGHLDAPNESDAAKRWLRELQLLTQKPVIYAFNISDDVLADTARQLELAKLVAPHQAVFISAKLEEELAGMSDEDRAEFLASYGVKDSGLSRLINAAYSTLGLQSFITAGEKEVRAWTIKKGATAPQAAGEIHTDFERGFIAAQVVNYDDLVAAGSEAAARAKGQIRTEGKDYVMQPDDVVEFRFNV